MQIFKETNSLLQFLAKKRLEGISIGFVPTMGALHEGHLRLIDYSAQQNSCTVCSIFINPTQFNNPDDLAKYPRNLNADLEKLANRGCDVVFAPDESEMYRENRVVKFHFGYLETTMEGKFRPGHFSGVGLVVSKLFNIVKPNRAYFGKKDLQQLVVIKKLVEELNFDIEICPVDTIREDSGLAMSSRNERLNDVERKEAAFIYRSLIKAKELLLADENIDKVKHVIAHDFSERKVFQLEYFEIVDGKTLLDITNIRESEDVSICVACYLGKVRLIDNISLF